MAQRWRIVIGSDEAGFSYKNELKAVLERDAHASRPLTTSEW